MSEINLYKLFLNYPYKNYQLKNQGLNREKMARFYYQNAMRDKCFVTHPQGLISASPLLSFSQHNQKCIWILKNFLFDDSCNGEQLIKELIEKIKNSSSEISSAPNDKQVKNWPLSIVSKQPIDHQQSINAHLKMGFYYVCSESIFTLDLDKIDKYDSIGFDKVEEAKQEDLTRVHQLSELAHIDIRYLFDSHYDKEQIKSFFSQIPKNSFYKKNERLWVYRIDGRVIGFITAIINTKLSRQMDFTYASLDYIAVDPKEQNHSIGFILNNYALNYLKSHSIRFVSVKTIGSNYKAINLLNKNLFKLTSQNLIFHYFHRMN